MISLKYNIKCNMDLQRYFSTENICFFDIETTGFNRNKDIVYLVGLLIYNGSNYVLKQYLLESIDEEKLLLNYLIDEFNNNQCLVTFNGDSFDIPFLNSKYKNYNINYRVPIKNSLDIYKIIKNNKYLFDLKSFKLKSIEKYLGINRKDNVSGKECISLFYDYLNNNNENSKELVLQHNYDDLYYLPSALQILDIIKDKKTIRISNTSNIKFLELTIEDLSVESDIMNIYCTTTPISFHPIIIYDNNFNINWNTKSGVFKLQLIVKNSILSTNESCIYIDLNDLDVNLTIKDCTNFNIPENLILIRIGKKFVIDNIKNLLYQILLNKNLYCGK